MGIGSIISAAVQGAISALLSPLLAMFHDKQQQQIGKTQQQNADLAAANKEARDAEGIDTSVSLAGAQSVDDQLQQFERK